MTDTIQLVAQTIHTALFTCPWEEQCDEVKREMLHAARRSLHVMSLNGVGPSERTQLEAMWHDVTSDPENLCVVLPRNVFEFLYAGYSRNLYGEPPLEGLTLLNIPRDGLAEALQIEDEPVRPKGIIRRWLEQISK